MARPAAERPELLTRYNDFKRRHTDVAADAYIEAKAEFIESVLGGPD